MCAELTILAVAQLYGEVHWFDSLYDIWRSMSCFGAIALANSKSLCSSCSICAHPRLCIAILFVFYLGISPSRVFDLFSLFLQGGCAEIMLLHGRGKLLFTDNSDFNDSCVVYNNALDSSCVYDAISLHHTCHIESSHLWLSVAVTNASVIFQETAARLAVVRVVGLHSRYRHMRTVALAA